MSYLMKSKGESLLMSREDSHMKRLTVDALQKILTESLQNSVFNDFF